MNDILTSESAISEYMPYPPYISRERLDKYDVNLKRYKGDYNEGKRIRIRKMLFRDFDYICRLCAKHMKNRK